jgi:hypothetical protein
MFCPDCYLPICAPSSMHESLHLSDYCRTDTCSNRSPGGNYCWQCMGLSVSDFRQLALYLYQLTETERNKKIDNMIRLRKPSIMLYQSSPSRIPY